MPSKIRCFLLVPTEEVVVTLRRYAYQGTQTPHVPKCTRREPQYPGSEIVTFEVHDVEVEIGREVGTLDSDVSGHHTDSELSADDPRWPKACACGYVFDESSQLQENRTRLYRRSDTGELTTISAAPVGAIYDLGDPGEERLMCKTPAGVWLIDHPRVGWKRVGTPPDIVVTPSIRIGQPQRMHGWLGGFHGKGDEPGYLCIDFP